MRLHASLTLMGLSLALVSCRQSPESALIHRQTSRGPVTVRLTAGPASMRVGEAVTLAMKLESPRGWAAEGLATEALGPSWKLIESGPVAGGAILVLEYDPLAKDPKAFDWDGPVTLAGLSLRLRNPQGEIIPFPLEELALERLSLVTGPADPAHLAPLKKPVSLPGLPLWVWILGAAGALVSGFLWWRKKVLPKSLPPSPPPSPFEEAWAALEKLAAEDLIGRNLVEEHVDRLSAIIRTYVEGQFGLRAPERTTEEFLEEASRSAKLAPQHKKSLAEFLEQADLVKFAKARPGPRALESFLESARKFLEETGKHPPHPDPLPKGEGTKS